MDSSLREEILKVITDPTFSAIMKGADYYERRSHFDRREEFQEWSKGVVESLKATKEDVSEVKSDVKALTSDMNQVKLDLALISKDRDQRWEMMNNRWGEMCKILNEIKEHGCDIYAHHHHTYSENARADERKRIEKEQEEEKRKNNLDHMAEKKFGRTWPDIVASFTPTNIALAAMVMVLLFYIFGGVDKILFWVGLG